MNDFSKELAEDLLESWVTLTGIIKNSRITKDLSYNEAIVMLFAYKKFKEDESSCISIKEIIKNTNMLKSLANRTINSLEKKGLLERVTKNNDKRIVYLRCVEKNLKRFLDVHNSSINLAETISKILGEEDTIAFIRIAKKSSFFFSSNRLKTNKAKALFVFIF